MPGKQPFDSGARQRGALGSAGHSVGVGVADRPCRPGIGPQFNDATKLLFSLGEEVLQFVGFTIGLGELLLESHDQIAAALHNRGRFLLPCLFLQQSNLIDLAGASLLESGQLDLDAIELTLITGE